MHAVRGIDLALEQGEIVAFLGPNGAGKTTTIDMMLGLSQPTTGDGRRARPRAAPGDRPRPRLRGDADRRPAQGPHRPRDRDLHRQPVRRHRHRSTRCSRTPASPGSPTARSASARAASSSGCGSRWRCCPTPRCCCSTSRPPGMDVEGRRAFWSAIRARRRAGPHRALRDALPRGGRPVRRPDRADQPGPDRRRRHRLARSRRSPPAARSERPCPAPTPPAVVRIAGVDERRGPRRHGATCTPRTATPSPATC